MSNTLYDYDNGMVQQHIDELRRGAAKARLVRGARRNRRRRQQLRRELSAHGRLWPAQAR